MQTRAARPEQPPRKTRESSAKSELMQALESLRSFAPGEERDSKLLELGLQAIAGEMEALTAIIEEMTPESIARHKLIDAALQKWLPSQAMEEARFWAASLTSPADRAYVDSRIALHLAAQEPSRAAESLSASSFEGSEVEPSAAETLRNWCAQQPTEAVQWASQLPAGPARNAGLQIVLGQWAQTNPEQAFQWTQSVKQPSLRQEAVAALSESLMGQPDPIRDSLLESAAPAFRTEIEGRISNLLQEQQQAEEAIESE